VAIDVHLHGLFDKMSPGLTPAAWKIMAILAGLVISLVMLWRRHDQLSSAKCFPILFQKKP